MTKKQIETYKMILNSIDLAMWIAFPFGIYQLAQLLLWIQNHLHIAWVP